MIGTLLDCAARHQVAPQVEHVRMHQVNEALRHLADGKGGTAPCSKPSAIKSPIRRIAIDAEPNQDAWPRYFARGFAIVMPQQETECRARTTKLRYSHRSGALVAGADLLKAATGNKGTGYVERANA